MRAQMGTEWQKGNYTIRNFDNAGGQPGRIQVADRIHVLGGTTFLRVEADFRQRWLLEAALSHNAYHNRFEAIDTDSGPGDLTAENSGEHPNPTSYRLPSTWMPRVAVSYHPAPSMTWRSVVSKGFSPPTTAEIRPSDNTVNTSLQAESGWNFETGFRLATRGQWLFGDLSIFRYELRNALVRGSRENGAEFFRNAGGIGQSGIELAFNVRLTGGEASATGMRAYPQIHWSGSWTWSDFRFVDYRINGTDYTSNALTGVPKHTLMNAFYLESVGPWNVHVMHRFVARTPLNDANAVFADAYHLVQARVSRRFSLGIGLSGSVFVWVDNLLDQRYSLGNDINAFGERYFNAAPGRNASAGISLHF